ncbi:MAG TPA: type III secretion system export apparatus subunit SctT [Arsenophonus sp.]
MHIDTNFYFNIYIFLSHLVVITSRIFPIFSIIPFLSNNILSPTIKFPLSLFIAIGIWPYDAYDLPKLEWMDYFFILLKEIIIGLMIAIFISLPFFVLQITGNVIDNQRGATLSSSIDPINGVDTSELANFFNLFAVTVFLANDGIITVLEIYNYSYSLWLPFSMVLPSIANILTFISYAIAKAVILASPLIIIFLVTEIMLGLLGRYAPQLNPFSIALTIKSLICFAILMIYFSSSFSEFVLIMQRTSYKLIQFSV